MRTGPPECRGTLLVLEEWCIVLGIVIAYWITYGTRYMAGEWSWRLPFLLQMVPGFVLLAGVMILPFSPRWLASKGRNEEALESLCKLRNLPPTDRRIRQEYLDIQAEVRFHQEMNAEKHPNLQSGSTTDSLLLELASWADCFRKGCWRRTHVGVMISFFQQVSCALLDLSRFTLASNIILVCGYQCFDLLLSDPICKHGPGQQHATCHVWCSQCVAIGGCNKQYLHYGLGWSPKATHDGICLDDYISCHHCCPGCGI